MFEQISIIATISGVISIIITIVSSVVNYFREKAKLRKAQDEIFERVLSSDNIKDVGKYLDDVIGKFSVYEYVNNSSISKKVNAHLDRLKLFIGSDSEIKEQSTGAEPSKESLLLSKNNLDNEYNSIVDKLNAGETWNALSQLRRKIEITVRDYAVRSQIIDPKQRSSAGYILNQLNNRELIPSEVYSDLKYAISICNNAVHGFEVNIDDARKAVFSANKGLVWFKQTIS